MSLESLTRAIERASTEASFREHLKSDPAAALKGYDLTADERAALLAGDAAHLESLGVDARITKQAIYIEPANPGSFAPGQVG